jgi:putative tryptophan/tyrosine transport system substrate-binding protein
VKRREFITLIGGAATWPLAARAQQTEHLRRIGVLMAFAEGDPLTQEYISSFRRGLSDAGWVEGRNLRVEYRWNVVDAVKAKTYAAELSQLQLDAILAVGGASTTATTASISLTGSRFSSE